MKDYDLTINEQRVLKALQYLGGDTSSLLLWKEMTNNKHHISIGLLFIVISNLEKKDWVVTRQVPGGEERGYRPALMVKIK